MNVKRFRAQTMQQGLKQVTATLGPEALILSHKAIDTGVEIIAALDTRPPDASVPATLKPQPPKAQTINAIPPVPPKQADAQVTRSEPPAQQQRQQLARLLDELEQQFSADQPRPAQPASTRPVQGVLTPATVAGMDALPSNPSDSHWQSLSEDLRSIKALLHKQVRQAEQSEHSGSPKAQALKHRLNALGLIAPIVQRVLRKSAASATAYSWEQALKCLRCSVRRPQVPLLSQGGTYALVGLTGSGKTTTLAKMASRWALHHGSESVAVIAMDPFRLGGQDALNVVTQLLNITLLSISESCTLHQALQQCRGKQLVLIDTSGCPAGVDLLQQQLSSGMQTQAIQILHLLPATAHYAVIEQFYRRVLSISGERLQGGLITKVDESPQMGAALSLLLMHRLALMGWSDGPGIPEQLHLQSLQTLFDHHLLGGLSPLAVQQDGLAA